MTVKNQSHEISKRHDLCTVFLIHGSEIIDLLENALISAQKSNLQSDFIAYCSASAFPAVVQLQEKYNIHAVEFDALSAIEIDSYRRIGTNHFNQVVSHKWDIILNTLDRGYDAVCYSDADIVFLKDYSRFILSASSVYNAGVQSESQANFTPHYCSGFMYFNIKFRDVIQELSQINKSNAHLGHDQKIFNIYVRNNRHLIKEILTLPEAVFQCGLHSRNYIYPRYPAFKTDIEPYIFHANWVVGLEAKRELLKSVRQWWLT